MVGGAAVWACSGAGRERDLEGEHVGQVSWMEGGQQRQ